MPRFEKIIRLSAALALVLSSLFYYAEPLPAVAADPEPVLPPITLPRDGNPKLDSRLNRLVKEQQSDNSSSRSRRAQPNSLQNVANSVRVIIETSANQTGPVRQAVAGLGVVEASDGSLLQVNLPVGQLTALAGVPGVRFVRTPYHLMVDVTSEGVGVTGADVWQSVGYNGTGVKIGIIDAGFAGYTTRQAEGELPASITTWWAPSLGGPGTERHGTGVAEIVYDMAPGAQFYLANVDTEVDLSNAVDWLISQNVSVISMSLGWYPGGPGDGTGIIAQIVDRARAAGILWVNSAGNSAREHWQGDFVSTDGDDWNDFSQSPFDETQSIFVQTGASIIVFLKWSDPWGSSSNNYDLYLTDNQSIIRARSIDVQNGNDDPVEALQFTGAYTGFYRIWIKKVDSPAVRNFHLYSLVQTLEYYTTPGSITIPADSPNAMAVGAVRYSTPDTIEWFSSQGPTVDNRIKPDIVAPDGVSTRAYSPGTFSGTSASAPHAAGAAVLVKQAFPSYNATQIQAFLEGRAVDLGASGKDNVYGSGRLSLGLLSPTVVTNNATSVTVNSVTLGGNLTWLGVASSVNVTFQWGTSSGNYTAETAIQTMTSTGSFSANLTSLSSNTTYYFRAKASGHGTTYGEEKSLTTASPLTVITFVGDEFGPGEVNLLGNVISLGGHASVNVSFLWGPQYQTNPALYPYETEVRVMTKQGVFDALLTGLAAPATYFFVAKARADNETAYGSGKPFYASAWSGAVSTDNVTNVSHFSAALSGNLLSLGTNSSMNVTFQYGTQSGNYAVNTTIQTMNATGIFSANLTGLSASTAYYFRAKASGHRDVYGFEKSFTTSAFSAQSVTTDNAINVTYNSARLNGTLGSLGNASSVNVSFQYGAQSGNLTIETEMVAMALIGVYSINATGLSANTTYYFRAKAVGDGTSYGSEKSFTTPLPPTVATSNATGIATRMAMLNGNLQSLGTYTSVNVSFSYGTSSTNLSQSTPSQEKSASGSFSANATLLSANTTYYYKAMAAAGTEVIVYGDILSFTTLPRPTWGANMTAGTATGGSNPNLRFGATSNATDGFDTNLDVPHIPPSPDATFDAYFYNAVATPFNKLDREYRTPADRMTWTVNISSPSQNVTLAWGIADIPSDLAVYMDTGAGAINMRTQNSTMLPAGNRSITISVTYDVEVSIDLKSGWNMISVPLVLNNSGVSVVFPTALVVYAWNPATKSYSAVTNLEPGKGYWVAVTTNTTVALSGLPVFIWTANMTMGWHMIGSVISQASFAAPEDNPDSSVMAFTYWWNPVSKSYVLGATVEPGKGYWVAATRAASLTLSAGGGVASMGTSASSSEVGSGVIDAANKGLTPGIEFAHPPSPPDATVPVMAPPVTRDNAGAGGAGDDGIGGGGGGGGGGVGFAGIGSLPLSGIGGISPLINGATGVTMTPANLTTNDGKVAIAIAANTTMLMSTGLAVTSLSVTLGTPPGDPPPQGAIVLNYNFGPDGATFDPSLVMTISYTDDQIPAGAAESNLFIAYWDGSVWVVIPSVTDAVNNTVTGSVAHFTNVALIAGAPAPQVATASPLPAPALPEPSPAPAPVPIPAPTSTSAPALEAPPVHPQASQPADAPEPVRRKTSAGLSSWWWIIGAVIGAAIIGGVIYRTARARGSQPNPPRE